ncbi:MAG: S8 family serine peptidase [Elusimicrobiota bacterium]
MKRLLCAIAILLFGAALSPAEQGPARIIISFKSGTSLLARQDALGAIGAQQVQKIESADEAKTFIAVVAKCNENSPTPLSSLAGTSSSILTVENDYRTKWIESDPESFQSLPFPSAASLKTLGLKPVSFPLAAARFSNSELRNRITWNIQRVDAPAAWNYTQGGGVKVAVIDTGIDYNHPALKMNVAGGYNAITGKSDPQSYKDDNGHGTHVSGIIAADGLRLAGVAPHAKLYAVKVLGSDGGGSLGDVIKGIIWSADHQMQVANMSLGTRQPSPAMAQAVEYAAFEGTVIVAAAGNSSGGPVSYPGADPYAIAVSASDYQDHLAPFSSVGPQVKFIAPGQDIVSSWIGGGYANLSGTSMAAPHVTGLIALSLSQGYVGLGGPDGALMQLEKAAKKLPSVPDKAQGRGFVDALKLVE